MSEPSKAARERARALVNGHFGMVEKAHNGERLVDAIAATLEEYAAERTAQEQANAEALARTAERAAVYWRQRTAQVEAERDATRVEVEELRARVSELEGPSPKLPPGCKCDPQGWWPNDAPPICSTCEEDVGIHVGCCRHCSHLTECHADRTDGGQGHE